MALITVVKSLIGQKLDLPGDVSIRPWAQVELEELSPEMKAELKELRAARKVQIGQVLDGAPLPNVQV